MRGSITGATYNCHRRISHPWQIRKRRQPPSGMNQAPKILLVDDELSVQKLLAFPLRREGYEVVSALDGQEALDRLNDTTFDLIVLDLMLPNVDGFEVCRQVRSRSSVPIIMLTAK